MKSNKRGILSLMESRIKCIFGNSRTLAVSGFLENLKKYDIFFLESFSLYSTKLTEF